MINRKTKKRAINKAIIDVVPQPGATFPYSELKGRKTPPKRVLNAINYFVYEFKTLKLKIYYLKQFVRIIYYILNVRSLVLTITNAIPIAASTVKPAPKLKRKLDNDGVIISIIISYLIVLLI